jgi:hypothetical protein
MRVIDEISTEFFGSTLVSSLRGAQATKQSSFACRIVISSLRGAK